MTCVRLGTPAAGVVCFDPAYRMKDRRGKVWSFEFHKFCGPTVLTKQGEPFRRFPGEKSPFWEALTAWIRQGQKVEERDGATWAVWTEGAKP